MRVGVCVWVCACARNCCACVWVWVWFVCCVWSSRSRDSLHFLGMLVFDLSCGPSMHTYAQNTTHTPRSPMTTHTHTHTHYGRQMHGRQMHSHLVSIPAGVVPSDVLVTSPVLNEGAMGGDMPTGVRAFIHSFIRSFVHSFIHS